uniref:Uncharacterized protein n=1 Tax=Heterorhabditis bacteriophora TaxID=37862 RepID=A0A1I7WC30_HETBA
MEEEEQGRRGPGRPRKVRFGSKDKHVFDINVSDISNDFFRLFIQFLLFVLVYQEYEVLLAISHAIPFSEVSS